MRPEQLTPLFAAAKSLAGIGPRMEILLKKALRLPPGVAEPRVIDLLWHTPTGVIDRRATPTVTEAVPGTIATLEVRVLKHRAAPRGNSRAPYKVACEDDSGRIDLVFFHVDHRFVERQLPTGSIRIVSGRIESYNDKKQMTHPDYIVAPEARADLPLLEPVYPLTAGLSGKVLLKAARQALERVPDLPEWQDAAWLAQRGWPDAKTALLRLHRPEEAQDVSPASPPWQRLAYDELLAGQLALALVRQSLKSQPGRQVAGDGSVRARIADALPFGLTNSQRLALKEIAEDMGAPHRMLRLLQGDVGSGKTVVALMAMAVAVEAGAQAALMAPTEVLARQHADTIAPYAEAAGLRLALLTGPRKGPRAHRPAGTAGGRRDRHPRRHARAVPGRRRLQGPGLRRHRRAAPLRRAPAPRPADQGRQRRRRRAGDDGDADPAHAADDALRRPRRVEAHGEAGGPQADRHPIHSRRVASSG